MAQQSARRGWDNQSFPLCFEHALGDLDPVRELPYRPAAVFLPHQAEQMTASDHAQQQPQSFPLREKGRPQMESRHSPRRQGRAERSRAGGISASARCNAELLEEREATPPEPIFWGINGRGCPAFRCGCAPRPASARSSCFLGSTATSPPTARSRCRNRTPRHCRGWVG
jgi:hypothetical protein